VAIEAIFFKEDAARAHCRWRGVHNPTGSLLEDGRALTSSLALSPDKNAVIGS
jgi:hypothetical protein